MTIQSNFFQYIFHVGCAINLHPIINSGLIPGGESSSKRQTVFFLHVDPMDKSHKDPDVIDLSVPRHAQYLHKSWKRHQDAEKLGRHQSCYCERIEILSDSIECNHPSRNTSSSLYSESCQDGNWRSLIRTKYACHLGLHQRSPEDTNGKENWVQNTLNDQKLGSYLEVSNRTNQFLIQFVRERGDPLSGMT